MSKTSCCAGTSIPPELCSLTASLKVIAEEHRLKILCLLRDGEHCVCEILPALALPQNLTSHHLKVLRDAGFISSRKDGQKVFYSLNRSALDQIVTQLGGHFTGVNA